MALLIQASSLMLATVALLYTVWSDSLEQVRNYDLDRHYPDMHSDHRHARRVYQTRALPIFIGTLLAGLIFLPKAFEIVRFSMLINFKHGPVQALGYYDIPSASLLLTEVFLLALAIHLFTIAQDIRSTLSGFEDARATHQSYVDA